MRIIGSDLSHRPWVPYTGTTCFIKIGTKYVVDVFFLSFNLLHMVYLVSDLIYRIIYRSLSIPFNKLTTSSFFWNFSRFTFTINIFFSIVIFRIVDPIYRPTCIDYWFNGSISSLTSYKGILLSFSILFYIFYFWFIIPPNFTALGLLSSQSFFFITHPQSFDVGRPV